MVIMIKVSMMYIHITIGKVVGILTIHVKANVTIALSFPVLTNCHPKLIIMKDLV